MSLYQKYRPKSFADVVGQEHVVTTLENAIAQDKVAHAYLFAGSRGTGKTSIARILAKAMLTRGIQDETLRKHIIQGVEDGTIVDLVEIDAASNRGIDDIRNLVEKIQFSPVVGSAKVYIIDEVHMLTREAFNALLKTLEEPPAYAFFILATTELQKIPATIQSRCQRFLFRQVSEEDLIRRLQFIADQEHIHIDREALRAIAHHAQGGMRDAISLLDQLRSLDKITLDAIRSRIGEAGHEHVEAVFAALERSDTAAILETIRKVEESGMALDVLARQLLADVRRRLHSAVAEKQPIHHWAALSSLLLSALRDMRIAPVPGLVLESALLSYCSADASSEPMPAPRKPQKKAVEAPPVPAPEKVEKKTAPAAPAAKETPPAQTAVIEAPAVDLMTVRKIWPDIVEEVQPASVKMSLKNGRVHQVRGNAIILTFASAFHRDKVAHTDASRKVEEVLEKHFKRALRIECTIDEPGSTPATSDDLVNVAEAAAEVF